jgi:branched-chain amino acid transport system permease protein
VNAITQFLARRWVRLAALGVLLVVLAVFPLSADKFTTQTVSHIAVVAVALLGLNIMMGYTGQVSLGHSVFVGLGAYAAIIPIRDLWGGPLADGAIALGFVLALAIPGVIGLLVAFAAVRLRGLALAMVSIALPTIAVPLAQRFKNLTGGSPGTTAGRIQYVGADGQTHTGNPFGAPAGSGLEDDQWQYYVIMLITVVVFVLGYFLVRGKFGRAFAIVKSNEAIAASLGVSPYRYKVLSLTIAAMYGGISGFLLIVYNPFTSPDTLAFHNSINYVIAMIVGGAGSIAGAVFGGIYYVLIESVLISLQIPTYSVVIQGVIIIAILFLLPGGLASLPRAIRNLTRRRRGGPDTAATPVADTTQHEIPS